MAIGGYITRGIGQGSIEQFVLRGLVSGAPLVVALYTIEASLDGVGVLTPALDGVGTLAPALDGVATLTVEVDSI